MRVVIETISHKKQRYDTPGDWQFDKKGDLFITVSKMGNWKYEMAVAYHELREALHCKHLGVSQKDIDAFDMKFEEDRAKGSHNSIEEPGNDPTAPYFLPHQYATRDERLLIADFGEDWNIYDDTVVNL